MLWWLFFLLILVVLIVIIFILYGPGEHCDADQNNIRTVTNRNSRFTTFRNFATTEDVIYYIPTTAAYRDGKLRKGQSAKAAREGISERCDDSFANVDFYTLDFKSQEFVLDPGNPDNIVGDIASESQFNFTENITTDTTWIQNEYGIPDQKVFTSSTGQTTVTVSLKTKEVKHRTKSYIEVIIRPSGPNIYLVGSLTAINSSIFPKLQAENAFRIVSSDDIANSSFLNNH